MNIRIDNNYMGMDNNWGIGTNSVEDMDYRIVTGVELDNIRGIAEDMGQVVEMVMVENMVLAVV